MRLKLNNLTRRYGKVEAVNGLSLTVPRGRCSRFFGRNGAGKTTTISASLNLLQPGSARCESSVSTRSAGSGGQIPLTYVPDAVAFLSGG